jgi:hypothetical protein
MKMDDMGGFHANCVRENPYTACIPFENAVQAKAIIALFGAIETPNTVGTKP